MWFCRAESLDSYIEQVGIAMDPSLRAAELAKLRHFSLILELDDFGILIIDFVDAFGDYLQTAAHPHQLSLQLHQTSIT